MIGKFTTLVDKLEKVASFHDNKAVNYSNLIIKAQQEHDVAVNEATRARKIAGKIKNLINA